MSAIPADASRQLRAVLARRTLPRRSDYAGFTRNWRKDLIAGLTVAVVALPLALGFGVSSGMGAGAGLLTAVVAGAVAAVFGGSNFQVSGPTGAMTVVLIPVIARYGVSSVATVTLIAGVLVLAAGLSGFGRLVAYIPWPVVEGFTAGIGVVIALQQIPLAVATPKADGDNAALVALRTLGDTAWRSAIPAILITLLAIAVGVLMPRLNRGIPASIVAVIIATLVVEIGNVDVPRIGTLPSLVPDVSMPALDTETVGRLFSAALAIAALAALESLLSARVADGMADDAPRSQPNRELVGQGLASIASALVGGMPATGAIARTAVNVKAGARTRAASIIHAVALAILVMAAAPLVAKIPLAALAGVLLTTAARMIDTRTAAAICRSGRAGASVFLLTFSVTVVFDLVLAVEIGVAAAALLALRAVARSSGLHREPLPDTEEVVDSAAEHGLLAEHIAVYRIDGALFFADVRRFLDELSDVCDVRVVVLRLSNIRVLDTSGANALTQIVDDLQRRGIVVILKGLRPEHRKLAESVGVVDALNNASHLMDDLPEAIAHARDHVHGTAVHAA